MSSAKTNLSPTPAEWIKKCDVALQEVFGFSGLLAGQREALAALGTSRDVLVIWPTGSGKSLCYQLPALAHERALTLVISPLIALMEDQVTALRAKGVAASFINSSLDARTRDKRLKEFSEGRYCLLYITPERLRQEAFWAALGQQKVKLLAVDEAHCISQWGQDFRPEYSRLKEHRLRMGRPQVIALTASATPQVEADIIDQLGMGPEIQILRTPVARANLGIHVSITASERMAELVPLLTLDQPTIVYFSLVQTLQQVAEVLRARGFDLVTYHGQMASSMRRAAQRRFLKNEVNLLLGTPAFGLGVDKPNIRQVIHFELPGSIEAYYQEIGRAGRDGLASKVTLLADEDDLALQMEFIKWSLPEPEFIRNVYQLLRDRLDQFIVEGPDFLRRELNFFNRRDYRVETALNLLERFGSIAWPIPQKRETLKVLDPPSGEWMDPVQHDTRRKHQLSKLLQMWRFCQDQKNCRMQLLGTYFGDSMAHPCGVCDNCERVKS